MCRIAGITSKQNQPQDMRHKVALMCHSLQHGGPDDEGSYAHTQSGVYFGHRRLSLIDLSSNGHQPMADINQLAYITFNGEIYNYLELKQELLSAGARFQSSTDTEVLIQAYLHWGTESFTKLRGMFAFALYDSRQQCTYLVRDTQGIKPLYYHVNKEQLSFASEVRAFKCSGIAIEADPAWQIRFLSYGHIPEPFTTLKNVFSLPKGSYLRWDHQNAEYKINHYHSASTGSIISNVQEAQELIRASLVKAVNRQLIADAPIGVFLSGGVDSSLLALLANQNHQHLQYISIYFNEAYYNEREFQQVITQQLSGQQHAHLVTYNDFEVNFPAIIQSMDMPTTDGVNTWFISKYARQNGLKAVLSGLGADELFGGYPSFQRIQHIKYLKYLPTTLTGKLAGLFKEGYKRIAYLKHQDILSDYLFLRGMFIPQEIARLLNTSEKEVEQVLTHSLLDLPNHLTGTTRAAWLETNLYMQNQLLRDTDVMSMSHGLEVRVPYLDEDFTAVVNRIDPQLRFSSSPLKKLLVESFSSLLPPAIYNRPKMGFSFPLQQWMKAYEGISNIESYKSKAVKQVIKRFDANQIHWSKAFALYQLQQHD